MKIDFNTVIKQPDGKPFRQPSGETEKDAEGKDVLDALGRPKPILEDLTLKLVASNALNTPTQDDAQLKGEERAKMGALAMTIHAWPVLDVPAGQIALLKERIAKPALGFGTVIVVQAHAALEGKTMEQALAKYMESTEFAKPWKEPAADAA